MRPIGTFLTEDLLKVNVRYKKNPLKSSYRASIAQKMLTVTTRFGKEGEYYVK